MFTLFAVLRKMTTDNSSRSKTHGGAIRVSGLSGRRIVLRTVGLLAVLLLPVPMSSALAQDESRNFRRALRLYLSDKAKDRKAGEAALRKMSQAALGQLKSWIAKAEKNLARVSRLTAQLDPESAPESDRQLRDFFLGKLEEGWDRLHDGNPVEARRIVEALLTFDGRSPRVFDYHRLLRATERRSLRDRVLEPSVRFTERVYEIGEEPIAIFRLRNRLEEQLVIGAQRGILGSLTIIIDRSPIQGSVHQDVTRSPIRTFQGVERLVLPGKGEKEIRIPIPLEESLSTSGLVLRVRIEGRFRPSRWEVEGKSVNLALPIPLAECWIVPVAQRRLVLSPLRKFEVALILRDIDTFFTAGQLAVWAAEEDEELKERLVKLLVGSLPQLDDYGFAIARRFLRQLSGLSGPELAKADRAFWKEWYEKERERSKAKGDAEKTPDETPAPRVGNEAPDR